MSRKTKLELTWVGKENRPRLEPRVLIDVPELSHAAPAADGSAGIMDNLLVQGDNLLALKALEAEYAERVKCVYIDPPFNTGSAFEHYDDGLEHSIWLTMMRDRLEVIHRLLSDDGFIALHLDLNEAAYCKVLLDEVFGRSNYLNTITTKTNDPSGFKSTAMSVFSTANQILFYAKEKRFAQLGRVFIPKGYDSGYGRVLVNPEASPHDWQWTGIGDHLSSELGFPNSRAARKELGEEFDDQISSWAIQNASRVFQLVAVGGGAALKRKQTIERSARQRDKVFIHPGDEGSGFYIANGRQLVFYRDRLVELDGVLQPGELITDIWTDVSWNGIGPEGGVDFKNGKKPEALVRRIIDMCTNPGDLVLDSFAGSGTTGAVAHKMGRRWIMVEIGKHAQTHIVPRLRKVIDGTDAGGVTAATNWQGGGGFRFCRLAPSLITRDKWGREVISSAYDGPLLAQALCKIKGFRYAPSDTDWWAQGKSSDTDFLHVTTQTLTHEQLAELSELVGEGRSLLILCAAWRGDEKAFPNLTISKIPDDVLKQCDFGREDYGLPVTGDAQ